MRRANTSKKGLWYSSSFSGHEREEVKARLLSSRLPLKRRQAEGSLIDKATKERCVVAPRLVVAKIPKGPIQGHLKRLRLSSVLSESYPESTELFL